MRYISILLIITVFIACNTSQPNVKNAGSASGTDQKIDSQRIAQIKISTTVDFRQVLDTLDSGDLMSLEVAGILLKNCAADSLTKDSLFLIFNDFMNHLSGSYLENNENITTQLNNSPSLQNILAWKRMFADHGLLLYSVEGSYFLEPRSSFLLEKYGFMLTRGYREFLAIESTDQLKPFASEGRMLIPTDSLALRIVIWEKFITQFPGFLLIKSAKDRYAQYLGAFLAGMDHSRVFDPETSVLSDSARTNLEMFITKNPQTHSAETVKSYLELLRSANYNYTEKVDSFLIQKVFSEEVADQIN